MVKQMVVISGARSFAGNLFHNNLCSRPDGLSIPIHSPSSHGNGESLPVVDGNNGKTLIADLTQPLAPEAANVVASADRVFHFAWDRSLVFEVSSRRNTAMVENLISAMPDPARFIFISSATAGPESPSTYGAVKYALEQRVLRCGGSVLIVGLVTSPKAGTAYESVRKSICGLPLRIYLDRHYRFYAVSPNDLIKACCFFLDEFEPGTYVSFPPGGQKARAFLAPIEMQCPRHRIPFYLHTGLGLAALKLARQVGFLSVAKGERLSNFLYRDRRRLASLPPAR